MDVFITTEAARTLGASRLLAPSRGALGFLLGHRRGDRVYVESALPSPSPEWPSLKAFYELDTDLERKIIGFFILGSRPALRRTLLQPFGTGKILVEFPVRKKGKAVPAASVIDYRDRFVFRKIPVLVEHPVI